MRKLTTDDLYGALGTIDRTSATERRDASQRLWVYLLLGLLMAVLTVYCLAQRLLWEGGFALLFALCFLYWSFLVHSRMKNPEVIVFFQRGEAVVHYSPNCVEDKETLRYMTEKKALKQGRPFCPVCSQAMAEADVGDKGTPES